MTTDTLAAPWPRDEPAPPDLVERTTEAGWDPEWLERALDARVSRLTLELWLEDPRPVAHIGRAVEDIERLAYGTLQSHIATRQDRDRLIDLFAESPEKIGDWEIAVERSPDPFAQLRLQERAYITILEDRGVALAAMQRTIRESIVGGQRMLVSFRMAQRVRSSARGQGYSQLLGVAPAGEPYFLGAYYHFRTDNRNAVEWLRNWVPDAAGLQRDPAAAEPSTEPMPGIPVAVLRLPPLPGQAADSAVRPARPEDLEACVALVNRTHSGADFFLPHSAEFLARQLEPPPLFEPDRDVPVYGWPDFLVLEHAGEVVACAGLWDRGRDIRERWHNRETGEDRTVDDAALLDFGYAEGCEDAFVRLLTALQARVATLARSALMAPVEHLPAVTAILASDAIDAEQRTLIWYRTDTPQEVLDEDITNPYTDLRYW